MTALTVTAKRICRKRVVPVLAGLCVAGAASAGMVTDRYGNVGYDTAAECDAAVAAGTGRFYQPVSRHAPRRMRGEVIVVRSTVAGLQQQAGELASSLGYNAANYVRGACDLGAASSRRGRRHVTPELVGKYVPFAPNMPVNVYYNRRGQATRVTMAQCDNRFFGAAPRPVNARPAQVALGPKVCYVDAMHPMKKPMKVCNGGTECYLPMPLPPSKLPGIERPGDVAACR